MGIVHVVEGNGEAAIAGGADGLSVLCSSCKVVISFMPKITNNTSDKDPVERGKVCARGRSLWLWLCWFRSCAVRLIAGVVRSCAVRLIAGVVRSCAVWLITVVVRSCAVQL